MKLGEAMYKASQEEAPTRRRRRRQPPAPAPSEDVVDADFEEIPEDERKRSAS